MMRFSQQASSLLKSPLVVVSIILSLTFTGISEYLLGIWKSSSLYLSQPAPLPQVPVITSPSSTAIQSSSTSIPTNSGVQDFTANWKTYIDTKSDYRYSVKYPPTCRAEAHCEGIVSSPNYICLLTPNFAESMGGGIINGGLIQIDANVANLNNPVDTYCSAQTDIEECNNNNNNNNNIDAFERKLRDYDITEFNIIKDEKFVVTVRAIYIPGSQQEILQTARAMLSTFKFL